MVGILFCKLPTSQRDEKFNYLNAAPFPGYNSKRDRIEGVSRDGMHGRASLPASHLCPVCHLYPDWFGGRSPPWRKPRPPGYCSVQPINATWSTLSHFELHPHFPSAFSLGFTAIFFYLIEPTFPPGSLDPGTDSWNDHTA